MTKPIVFLSSPFLDLESYRKEAIDTINSLKYEVQGMEFFGARSERPLNVCLNEVEKSNIYIGILSMKYGSIEEGSGKSFTHLEYDRAIEKSLPILIFLVNEHKQEILPKNVDIGENGILLRQFKNHLKKNHTPEYFTTPQDLSNKIKKSLVLKFEDMKALIKPTEKGDNLTIDEAKKETYSIKGNRKEDRNLSIPIKNNTNFYLHYETQVAEASMVVYLRFTTDKQEIKWIGFGTVTKIKNDIKDEHVFRIGYPSMTKKSIKENLLDKIAESGLGIEGIPTKIIKIRFRSDIKPEHSIEFIYGFEDLENGT